MSRGKPVPMNERKPAAGRRVTLQLDGESDVSPSQPPLCLSLELSEHPLCELDVLSSLQPPLELPLSS